MQRLFAEMRHRLGGFLSQRESAFLVASCGPTECLSVHKTLEDLETTRSELFWLFAAPFDDVRSWSLAIARDFAVRHEASRKAAELEGETLPPLPPALLEPSAPPIERVRSLFVFARDLAEDVEATQTVIGILPSEIRDPARYAEAIVALVRHEPPIPWFHHLRFVVREDATNPLLTRHAQPMARTDFYAPDLGGPAVEKALEDEAKDESLPLPERLQALFILAGTDIAHARCTEAIEKFSLLTRYHGAMGNVPLHALSLNGIGEAFARAGQHTRALDFFEQALVPALAALDAQTLVNVTFNLAQAHREQRRWQDALEHYEALGALAQAVCNAMLRILAYEQAGFCHYKLGDWKAAHAAWRAGVELARGVGENDVLLSCLDRIRALFVEARLNEPRRSVEEEIRQAERDGARRWDA